MVIKISRVHSPVVKAADCRSAGPWFNSGRWTWFTFVTWSDKLTNHNFLMINIMSPITTSIRTITRKSVNMVAELSNDTAPSRILDITDRLKDNPVVTKVLHAIALKTPSRFGADAVVDWMQWSGVPILAGGPAADRIPGRLRGESLDRLGNPTFRLGSAESRAEPRAAQSTARGPVDYRYRRPEDDGGSSRGGYSSI